VVNHHCSIELAMAAETLPKHPWPSEPARDDFDHLTLGLCWNFLRNPDPCIWSLKERPGWLRLHGSPATLNETVSPAFIGRRQQHFACSIRTLLEFHPQYEHEEAGLTILSNEKHHYEIAITLRNHVRCVIVRRRIGDLVAIVAEHAIDDGPVEILIQLGQSSQQLAMGATRYLSSEVAETFMGVYLGMYATGNGQSNSVPADFDWFEYSAIE